MYIVILIHVLCSIVVLINVLCSIVIPIHALCSIVVCIHYYTCLFSLTQAGILTTLNTIVSILADARDLSKVTSPINTKKYEVAMTTTENTGEIPKFMPLIL